MIYFDIQHWRRRNGCFDVLRPPSYAYCRFVKIFFSLLVQHCTLFPSNIFFNVWQYPSDPPYVDIIGSKGLDEKRKNHLKTSLLDKAREMASFLMLVTLCEVSSYDYFGNM